MCVQNFDGWHSSSTSETEFHVSATFFPQVRRSSLRRQASRSEKLTCSLPRQSLWAGGASIFFPRTISNQVSNCEVHSFGQATCHSSVTAIEVLTLRTSAVPFLPLHDVLVVSKDLRSSKDQSSGCDADDSFAKRPGEEEISPLQSPDQDRTSKPIVALQLSGSVHS